MCMFWQIRDGLRNARKKKDGKMETVVQVAAKTVSAPAATYVIFSYVHDTL